MPKSKKSGTLKALWKAYQDRNKRYEQMNDKQKEMWDAENIAIAEHNRRIVEKVVANRKKE
jgi:hypothetical protein